jgi:hypothetical protein
LFGMEPADQGLLKRGGSEGHRVLL